MANTGTQEHSPLPWRVEGRSVLDAVGNHVCSNGRGGNDREFVQQGNVNMALIAKAANHHADLLAACEAWMLVESETNHPCPDLALRSHYRKQAIQLTEAAIAKATTGPQPAGTDRT